MKRLLNAPCLILAWPLLVAVADAADPPPAVRVMSFNIRYGTADDGENRWEKRREFLVETIAAFNPDLVGTQETLAFQRDYLDEWLSGHEAFGVGRDDGAGQGEMTAVLFRRERFDMLDGGHFWLSETPDVPGSKSWDSALTRMVTWLKLHDRPARRTVWFFNTHFDHRGEQARLESARLIRRRISELAGADPVILTGDFNAAEASAPYQALFAERSAGLRPLVDTYRAAHPRPIEPEGTFSGFAQTRPDGRRIDWIACSNDWTIDSAAINRTARDGRTPSDHLPVTAVLRYRD